MGGRWNSPGRPVVYMAESVSLAVLENLVHLAKEDFPTGFVVITVVLPDGIVIMTEDQLVAQLGLTDPKTLGDRWFDLRLSAVLAVRSKIVPFEQFSSEVAIDTSKNFVRIHDYKNLQGVVIENADIAKTVREIFEMVWRSLPAQPDTTPHTVT